MKFKKKLSPEIRPIHQQASPKISSASETVQASNDDNLKTSACAACTWRLHRDSSSQPRFLASPLVVPTEVSRGLLLFTIVWYVSTVYTSLYIPQKMLAKENHRLFLIATFGVHNQTVPRKVGISVYVYIYIYIYYPP